MPGSTASLLGHRVYDASTGRFLNRDPIGYGGGVNLYGFVGNNPVNEQDPSGFNPFTRWVGRQAGRFGRWFMGGGVSGPHIGQGRGDLGLDPDEMDVGACPISTPTPSRPGGTYGRASEASSGRPRGP